MLKQIADVYDLLDDPAAGGHEVAKLFPSGAVSVTEVDAKGSRVDFLKIALPGRNGRIGGGAAPTMGILGCLGGLRIPSDRPGLSSDADGAIVALACALRIVTMNSRGQQLMGDVIVTTHLCQRAVSEPHDPYPFVISPVGRREILRRLVDADMDAMLTSSTTRGNWVLNHKGFAITPTVKEGWVLRASNDLLSLMQYVTGDVPVVLPITTQDITPIENGVYHVNGIMMPATVSKAPVVGVALTAKMAVPAPMSRDVLVVKPQRRPR